MQELTDENELVSISTLDYLVRRKDLARFVVHLKTFVPLYTRCSFNLCRFDKFWRIRFQDEPIFLLRNTKGLRHLQQLLSNPYISINIDDFRALGYTGDPKKVIKRVDATLNRAVAMIKPHSQAMFNHLKDSIRRRHNSFCYNPATPVTWVTVAQ